MWIWLVSNNGWYKKIPVKTSMKALKIFFFSFLVFEVCNYPVRHMLYSNLYTLDYLDSLISGLAQENWNREYNVMECNVYIPIENKFLIRTKSTHQFEQWFERKNLVEVKVLKLICRPVNVLCRPKARADWCSTFYRINDPTMWACWENMNAFPTQQVDKILLYLIPRSPCLSRMADKILKNAEFWI